MTSPIDLYFWPSPNGWKIAIMLEECGLPYRVTLIDPACGYKLFETVFRASPSGRVPAILDRDSANGSPVSLWGSAAILQYLGDKAGAFYPPERSLRLAVDRWLFWRDIAAPTNEQSISRSDRNSAAAGAVKRFTQSVCDSFAILDEQLGDNAYVAGSYSIADMALWPWVRSCVESQNDLSGCAHVMRWFGMVGDRRAVKVGGGIGRSKIVNGRTTPTVSHTSRYADPVIRRYV